MLKYEVEFINKANIDRSVWDKLNAIRNQANVLKLDIKRRTPDYNAICTLEIVGQTILCRLPVSSLLSVSYI